MKDLEEDTITIKLLYTKKMLNGMRGSTREKGVGDHVRKNINACFTIRKPNEEDKCFDLFW